MKRILQGLGFATLLALVLNVGVAHAQTAAATTTSTVPLRYDISKEITLSATVQSVSSKSSHALASTSGLMLQTNSGTLQGRLTAFTLSGKGALTITQGEQVQVTGVMTTAKNNKQVFLIRTIQIAGRTYAIRNERGFPLEHPMLNPSTTTESKGGQL
jgi:DNA/RNA endonuclease YhcR with UshA esterase domain